MSQCASFLSLSLLSLEQSMLLFMTSGMTRWRLFFVWVWLLKSDTHAFMPRPLTEANAVHRAFIFENFILLERALASSSGGAVWPGVTRVQLWGSTQGVRGDLSEKFFCYERKDGRTHIWTDRRDGRNSKLYIIFIIWTVDIFGWNCENWTIYITISTSIIVCPYVCVMAEICWIKKCY